MPTDARNSQRSGSLPSVKRSDGEACPNNCCYIVHPSDWADVHWPVHCKPMKVEKTPDDLASSIRANHFDRIRGS